MKWGKNLIGLVVAVILGLSLILVPVVSRLSPVQAAVTWRKYGEVTLDSEVYVFDAWVIKESSTSYKMWYTHGKVDLSISEIIDAITALNLDAALIGDIGNLDLAQFLNDLNDLTGDVSAIVDLLDGISTVIGYATSSNGITWDVQNSQALTGISSAAWHSVGAPCVIWDATANKYKMWYTRAKIDLNQTDLGNILDDMAVPATRKAAILDLMDSISTVIDYATSDNGADWAVQGSQVLPVSTIDVWSSVGDPSVIKNSDTDYEMWYTRPKTDLDQADLDTILTNIGTFGIDDLLDILDGTSTVIGYATSNNGVTWTEQNYQVLPVSSVVGAWDSVADPSVVKTGSSYEMWYTNVKTNLLEADLHTLANEIKELDIAALWTTLNGQGIFQFITDLVAGIDDIKALLYSTSTVIGYATWDGVSANWTVQNPQHLVGSSGSPWSSVAAPSVVKTGSRYEMWYTEGISDLIWQNLLDLLLGDNLPIGYAYYIPPAPRPRPLVIETNLFGIEASYPISSSGEILEAIEATSEDGTLTLTIEAGTIALLEDEPLETLEAAVEPSPPEPPEDSNVIGLVYDFGPDTATFDLPITLTFTYDELLIPEGVAEENLVIAMWDEEAGEWVNLDCIVNISTHTITAKVAHFTYFMVLAYTRPAVFVPSDLSITPAEVDIGGSVTISVLITNAGDLTGSYEVALKIDNVVVATKEITLAGGASQKVTFTTSKDVAGTYSVDVSGLTGSFAVREEVVPPVVPPVPAAFTISSLTISPTEVDIGEEITISVLIANTGDLTGSYEVTLKIDDVAVATKEVVLFGGASQQVTFTTSKDVAGTYSVDVSGLTGSFTVKEEVIPLVVPPVVPKAIAWWVWLVIGLVSAAVVGFAVWMVVRRQRA